jgi:hypothetical protein
MGAKHAPSGHDYRRPIPAGDDPGRIEFTPDDLARLELFWTSRWRRQPTPSEVRALVDEEIREEILYREALALGLDRDDMVVKRYLSQKLGMVVAEMATVAEPDRAEMKLWFVENAERFELPPRASFRHVYFSVDARKERAQPDAEAALADLRDGSVEVDGYGDAFPFQAYFADRTPEEIGQVFGHSFARALFELPPGTWERPIESAFGWHLVWIDSLAPGRVPAFDEVEAAVRAEWRAEQRVEAKRAFYESVRDRYEVVVLEDAHTIPEGAES